MKRSDVIRELKYLLLSTENLTMPTNSYLKEVELAREILDLLESIGMAPPVIAEESWKIKENGEMTYEERYWEPEDGPGGEK